MLANFAKATNWSDFEVILAFVAQVTTDAKAKSRGGTVRVSGDPLREWETWRKGKVGVPPRGFEMIAQSLSDAGFNPILASDERRRCLRDRIASSTFDALPNQAARRPIRAGFPWSARNDQVIAARVAHEQ